MKELVVTNSEEPEVIEGNHNGRLTPWKKGQSGNPAGKRRQSVAVTMLFDAVDNPEMAANIVASYLNLVVNAKSESLRFAAQQDFFDRCGLPRLAADREGQASAMAQVVNIIRNGSPELGV